VNAARIVVADPLRIVRTGVNRLLVREGDFEVAEAATLDELVAVVTERPPDLVLVDLDLPAQGGIEATRQVTSRCSAAVVVWGFDPSGQQALAAVRAGADGILRKDIPAAGLVRALRGALRGEAPLARDLASVLLDALHQVGEREEALARAGYLSLREREVLGHVAAGARNREIAEALAISEFTVKRHVQKILRKLELPSRRAAGALYQIAYGEPAALSRSGA
jgi:DNA-binding NarL/FixJ family response regulator